MNNRILVVDDNSDNLELTGHLLESKGFDFATTTSSMEALVMMENERFQLVISDLMMPHMDGIQLLEKIKNSWPETEVIIVTAHGSIKSAVEAIKKGAYSYILKPFEPDDVINQVKKVLDLLVIKRENQALKMQLESVKDTKTIIGKTPQIKAVLDLVKTVSGTNATVLIHGESGTGKELIAHAIHNQSERKSQPFIKVACAALSESLLESELFGHEKGSFTGAIGQKKGRFEVAHHGTIFLDEIGDISPTVQVKLLRVLQEREFERVGGTKPIKTDVRIIAATNRDLANDVNNGRFREDLFYRLNVINVNMPSLSDRRDDIPLLTEYFLQKYRLEVNKMVEGFTDKAMKSLVDYNWPGNIRELQNVVERAVVLAKGKMIDNQNLPDNVRQDTALRRSSDYELLSTLKEAKQVFEKQFLVKALKYNNGNISRTADMIKLARKNLQDKIKSYEIDVNEL
ncbi:MAG: sigma-54-dependent transcriptional regulator, partial [Nitrospinota bacterium]